MISLWWRPSQVWHKTKKVILDWNVFIFWRSFFCMLFSYHGFLNYFQDKNSHISRASAPLAPAQSGLMIMMLKQWDLTARPVVESPGALGPGRPSSHLLSQLLRHHDLGQFTHSLWALVFSTSSGTSATFDVNVKHLMGAGPKWLVLISFLSLLPLTLILCKLLAISRWHLLGRICPNFFLKISELCPVLCLHVGIMLQVGLLLLAYLLSGETGSKP